jgi:hypothetical protein
MKASHIASVVVSSLVFCAAADAEPPEHVGHPHMSPAGTGQRLPVAFPVGVREQFLSNMRGHLVALGDILSAMSTTQYAKAADIAETRLGMNSPGAAGCKIGDLPGAPAASPAVEHAEHPMQQFMPPSMRHVGLEMHEAASEFAVEARKAAQTGDPTRALAALATVTQRCAACHAGYAAR